MILADPVSAWPTERRARLETDEALMKPSFLKRAPANLPPAESVLVAEGGNVLASDDAPVATAPAPAAGVAGTPVKAKRPTAPCAAPRTASSRAARSTRAR
jgi:hypothetical protein